MPDVTITITVSTGESAQAMPEAQLHGGAPSLPATPPPKVTIGGAAGVSAPRGATNAAAGTLGEPVPLPLDQLGAPATPAAPSRPADLTPPDAAGSAPQTPSPPAADAPEDIEPPPRRKTAAKPKPKTRSKSTK